MSTLNTPAGVIKLASLDRLTPHKTVQRRKNKSLINNISTTFSWNAFGVPTAFADETKVGHYWIIDGQNRIDGLKKTEFAKDENGKSVKIPILIVEGEADIVYGKIGGLFEGTVTRKNQNARTMFVPHWKEKRPDYVATVDILNEYGISVGFDQGKARVGQTKCPHVFLVLYRLLGKDRYAKFAKMLVAAFSRPDQDAVEEAALRPDFIHGWIEFFSDYADTMNVVQSGMVNANLSSAEIVRRAAKIAEKQGRSGWIYRREICNQFVKLIGKYA